VEHAPVPPRSRFFTRTLEIPAGAPWDQAGAARLEGLHGSPLPADQVVMQVRRLERWRPRRPARFAAIYVRASELTDGLVHEAVIDGRRIRFTFRDSAATARRSVDLALTALLVAGAVLAAGFAVKSALAVREAKDAQILRLEQNAERRERQARKDRQLAAEARLIRAADAQGHDVAHLLTDLGWLAAVKTTAGGVQRIEWTPDAMTVTAMGREAPVFGEERPVAAIGEAAGATRWKIDHAPPAVRRGGVQRPNVVERPSARPSVAPAAGG
jgi:hypothetical protein